MTVLTFVWFFPSDGRCAHRRAKCVMNTVEDVWVVIIPASDFWFKDRPPFCGKDHDDG